MFGAAVGWLGPQRSVKAQSEPDFCAICIDILPDPGHNESVFIGHFTLCLPIFLLTQFLS
jgi:hypothetical protein